MKNSKLKIIAISLLLIGIVFVAANFISPHTISVQKQIQVWQYQQVTGLTDTSVTVPPWNLTNPGYEYFSSENMTPGQTLNVDWYATADIYGYIFSQQQFAYFQSIFPNILPLYRTNVSANPAVAWANENGFAFEATNDGEKYGGVSYNVTESGDYVSAVTNGMIGMHGGPMNVGISSLTETVASYFYQTQFVPKSDNLYMYVGSFLIIAGILSFVAIFTLRKF